MKNRWKLLVALVALLLALLLALIPNLKTGIATRNGSFNWIHKDTTGVEFIISP